MKKKKWLDYLIIPNSGGKTKKQRINVAREELNKRGIGEVLVVKGKDSEEDILYLGKIVKKGDCVGIDTFPLHFKEYRALVRRAKKYGEFPRGVRIENVATPESLKQHIYGFLGSEEEILKKRKLQYIKKRHEKALQAVKNFVKRVINIS